MTIEYREFEVREVNEELRQVSGLAVPYGQSVNIGDYKEQIQRGAFGTPENVALFYGHNHRNGGMPIGKVVQFRDTDEGLEIDAVISKTRDGDEVYTLLKDGVLNRFSVGFEPVDQKVDGDTVVRTKANLREVSIVPMPAYAAAKVSNVRSDERSQTQNTEEEVIELTTQEVTSEAVAEIREAVTDLERKFAGFSVVETKGDEGSEFRSYGEYVKELALGNEKAAAEYRAYSGATTADTVTKDGWVGSVVRLVEDNRKVLNAFSKGTWVAEGKNVEYAVLDGNTTSVTAQAAEGDDLAYGKVTIGSDTAPKKTYGGYTELTRQEIEMSSVNILDTSFRALAIKYASATNAAVRTALAGATGTNTAVLSANTAAGWLELLVDAAIDLDVEGVSPEFIIVSGDQFKKLASLTDGGRPLMDYGTGSNTIGNLTAPGLKGSLAGVPVIVDAGAADNTCFVAHSEAIKTFEQPGAPLRLQDENIVNLSKTFSVYGYMAVAVQAPKLLVKCDVDLV